MLCISQIYSYQLVLINKISFFLLNKKKKAERNSFYFLLYTFYFVQINY